MKYCSHCGKRILQAAKFCGHCGEKNTASKPSKNSDGGKKPRIASQSKRFINMLIDYTLGAFLASWILGFILGFLGFISGYEDDSFYSGLAIVGAFAYYFLCEHYFGKTIGKMITKTRVTTKEGRRPTPKQILARTLIRYVPFEAFSFFGKNPIGWHDEWSKTIVIEE